MSTIAALLLITVLALWTAASGASGLPSTTAVGSPSTQAEISAEERENVRTNAEPSLKHMANEEMNYWSRFLQGSNGAVDVENLKKAKKVSKKTEKKEKKQQTKKSKKSKSSSPSNAPSSMPSFTCDGVLPLDQTTPPVPMFECMIDEGMPGCGFCLFNMEDPGCDIEDDYCGTHVCLTNNWSSEVIPLCSVCDPSSPHYVEDNVHWNATLDGYQCVCPGDCPSWVYRSLQESPFERHLHETTDEDDITRVIEKTGGDPNGHFHEKEGLLTADQIKLLRAYVDDYLEEEGYRLAQKYRDDYSKDIPISYLTDLIGMNATQNILQFFYTAMGGKTPIMRAYLRRSYMDQDANSDHHVPYHVEDDRYIMILALNGNEEYSGGELIYLDRDGPKEAVRTPGKAIVHGPGDIHGVAPHNGTRYTLFFWAKPESYCILGGTDLQTSLEGFNVI